ncbi:MAG: DUF1631 family protein [Burkholderiales bacterium]|nr:MAG: DUF1631 family protein [Betaproteobacteria bacterium]TAG80718.1 MAG: DUF1631 family protein [Burkholderiales bacterium]
MNQQPLSAERRKVLLGGCRDLMLHRARLQLATAFDRLAEVLIENASKSFEPKVVSGLMEARSVLQRERASLSENFSASLQDRLSGKVPPEISGPPTQSGELKLQSVEVLDEVVSARSLAKSIESSALGDLPPFHQRIAVLHGDGSLTLAENVFGPVSVIGALLDAMQSITDDGDMRVTWLRGLTLMGGLGFRDVYADLNRFLVDGGVNVPQHRAQSVGGGGAAAAAAAAASAMGGAVSQNASSALTGGDASMSTAAVNDALSSAQMGDMQPMQMLANNLIGLVQRLQSVVPGIAGGPVAADPSLAAMLAGKEALQVSSALGFGADGNFRSPITQSYDRNLITTLTALQAATPAVMPIGMGIAPPRASVLREVVPGYASGDISVLDATTTELVAMLFEFVFARRELRDEIKVLLGRLQIPMLKGAMVDRGFFSRKNHPGRQLLNRLADLGIGWNPEEGPDDSVYKKIREIVDQVNKDFTDDLGVFTAALVEVEQFIGELELDAQPAIEAETKEAETADRHFVALQTAKEAVETRIAQHALPEPVREFIEVAWQPHLQDALLEDGKDSKKYEQAVTALDELIWSVAPKEHAAERVQLGQRLPSLVKRLRTSLKSLSDDALNPFFDRLFEVHSGLLKGNKPAYVEPEPMPEVVESEDFDPFNEIVKRIERNQWIEISDDKGALTYAKLAWISPQATTYLFTTRHGRKAASLSPGELAEWFRTDKARLIESEPIVDRALAGMFQSEDA